MAKGIAGGFPFGAFALSEAAVNKLEIGDHGGTYCGNPLGCAVLITLSLHHLNTFLLYTIFNSAITHSIFCIMQLS